MNEELVGGPKPKPPTRYQVEKLRLILSTYQDGTGMLATDNGMTLPGWRDFERAVAAAFGGTAQESKYVFDVLVPVTDKPRVMYGVSCKMRGELDRVTGRDGRITIELSNSAKQFWGYLGTKGIREDNYRSRPTEVGIGLIELVESWHERDSISSGGIIDLNMSSYLVLSWNKKGLYQLHQFPLTLPQPKSLMWYFPNKKEKGVEVPAQRLCGEDSSGVVFEWYGLSGGQLKYYPLAKDATWVSEPFRLESLPSSENMKYGVLAKAALYFPEQWQTSKELE